MSDNHRTILCVDDDEDILLVMNTILEKGGYTCLTASNAEEGMRLFGEQDPDAAIVDMMMESIDAGNRLAEKMKSMSPDKPVYILSSIGDDLAREVGDLGVDGVLQKPVDGERLLEILGERFS